MKQLLFLLTALILTTAAHALVDVTYNFNTNNVNALAYDCLDSTCSQVKPFSGSFPNTKSTTNGALTIRFPSTLANQFGYALYFTSTGHIAKEGRATWHSFGDNTLFTTEFDVTLNRIANCRSLIDDVTVLNIDKPNLPVIIETTASLDALTHSAFTLFNNDVAYIPPELKDEFYSSDVRVTLVIKDETGSVVDRQTTEFAGTNSLFADEEKPVRFEFLPRTAGQFTATVTTDVIDNQCTSTSPQSSSKQFTILEELPRNSCFTLLNGLRVFPEDSAEAFTGEKTYLLEKIDRQARQIILLEGNTQHNIGLDTNFRATFTTAGNTLSLTLKPNDHVQIEGLPTPNEVFVPQGSTFTTFSATSVSKKINFEFEKTSTHITDNTFSQAVMTPVPARIQTNLRNNNQQSLSSFTFLAGANPDTTNPAAFGPFFHTTTQTGLHTLTITGQAESTLCNNLNNTPETLTTELFVRTPQTFTVNFQVVDAATGQPIENTNIALGNKLARTDKNGHAVFAGIKPTNYPFTLTHQTFNTHSGTVLVTESDVTILISLQRGGNNTPPSDDDDNDPSDDTDDSDDDENTAEPDATLKIESIRYPETAQAGDVIKITLGMSNTGNEKLENVKLTATILELGNRRRAGPFDLSQGDHTSRTLIFDLFDAEPTQEYTLRFELGNDEVKRIIHRPLIIE